MLLVGGLAGGRGVALPPDAFCIAAPGAAGVEAAAIDTNGAGDMFAGAFLYAITSGRDCAWAADLANDCAARVVAQFGPRLDEQQFDKIKTQFGI